jgi:hypothetical protein
MGNRGPSISARRTYCVQAIVPILNCVLDSSGHDCYCGATFDSELLDVQLCLGWLFGPSMLPSMYPDVSLTSPPCLVRLHVSLHHDSGHYQFAHLLALFNGIKKITARTSCTPFIPLPQHPPSFHISQPAGSPEPRRFRPPVRTS